MGACNGVFGTTLLIILYRVFMIKAIIVGTVFVKLKDVTSAFYSRSGVLFL